MTSTVIGEPEEIPSARRFLPSRQGDSEFDVSNDGFKFSMFPPFWRKGAEKEAEGKDVGHDEEKEIWTAVMDRAARDDVTQKPSDFETQKPSDFETEDKTEVTSSEETSSSSTAILETSSDVTSDVALAEDTSEDATSDVALMETAAQDATSDVALTEAAGEDVTSSESSSSKISSTASGKAVEADLEVETLTLTSDSSFETQDDTTTSLQTEKDEPLAVKEEPKIPTILEEESVPSKKTERPVSKRIQEDAETREAASQTVELTSQRPPLDTDQESSTQAENKGSHHIGHNLKVVTWTLAGVCLSVVVIGNFLGIYFSYIKPRMHQSTLV